MKKPLIRTYSALKSRCVFDVLEDNSLLFRSKTVGEINNGISVDVVEKYRLEDSSETTTDDEGQETTTTTTETIIDAYECTISKFDQYEIEFTGTSDIYFYIVILQQGISSSQDHLVNLTYDGTTFDGIPPGGSFNDGMITFAIPKIDYEVGDEINVRVYSTIETYAAPSAQALSSIVSNDSSLVDLRVYTDLDVTSLPQGDRVVLAKPGTIVTPGYTEEPDGIWTRRIYDRVTLRGAEGLPVTPAREYTGLYRTVIHINYSEDRGPFRTVNSIYKWNNGTWTK